MPQPREEFAAHVLDVVTAIPAGTVLSYSDVAAVLGSRAARVVGQVMAHSGGTVPWWRVVRASGHPAEGHEAEALEHYLAEGTPLRWSRDGTRYRVEIESARGWPEL